MKNSLILFFCFTYFVSFTQTQNSNETLNKNKVKKCFETHCFVGSNSSCTSFNYEFDHRGNTTLWNMTRLGSYYRSSYNENNFEILHLTISSEDEIDTVSYHYDSHNNLDKEIRIYKDYDKQGKEIRKYDTIRYKNTYDALNRLVSISNTSLNYFSDVVIDKTIFIYDKHNNLIQEIDSTRIIPLSLPTTLDTNQVDLIKYEYDANHNCVKTIYLSESKIEKIITRKFDTQNRLIEEVEIDKDDLKLKNEMNVGRRGNLNEIKTVIKYLPNGQVDEMYNYFSDPCMSLDNHFLYKHHYLSNELLDYIEAYEEGEHIYSISFSYEYFGE